MCVDGDALWQVTVLDLYVLLSVTITVVLTA